jgi:transcriptional regulator with XRE-family HTH domain
MAEKKVDPVVAQEAQRLRALYDERVRPTLSETEFGERFKIGSQGMVWQYLNGRRPLNIESALAFAEGLGVTVHDISPRLAQEFEDLIQRLQNTTGSRIVRDDPGLALKLRQAMADHGVSTAELARFFGVKPVEVSEEWRVHGRIPPKQYPKLVGYFGKPYEWWFGDPEGAEPPNIYALRRDNLRRAIAEIWGGAPAVAAAALGLTVEQIHNHIETGRHSIVPSLARKIERVAKLGAGWMDIPHDEPSRTTRTKRKRA